MKTIGLTGFQISNADLKALDHYLAVTPKQWAEDALKGMINKAVKTVLRDWLDLYRSKNASVPADKALLIPAVIAMPEFKPYHHKTDAFMTIERKEPCDQEIWAGGFVLQDYEDAALKTFYENYEEQLRWFMHNKVWRRKCCMRQEALDVFLKDPLIQSIPASSDDIINLYVTRPGYKTRKVLEGVNEVLKII